MRNVIEVGEQMIIQEVIVVEGKNDIAAVHRAVKADCLATGGFALSPYSLEKIKVAYQRNGIIILTDPDTAGERIRKVLTEKFPLAKHAFISQEDATLDDDIGVERANAAVILSALAKARCQKRITRQEFLLQDMAKARLSGGIDAAKRRAVLGEKLGIGYSNAKTFLRRLNNYGVTREEFEVAIATMEE